MNKKCKALGLVLGMSLMSVSVMAQPVASEPIRADLTEEKQEVESKQLNLSAPITRAEFINAVINPTDEKMPQIMDTHYALPIMERAESLGLITLEDYPMAGWSEEMPLEEKEAILEKARANNGVNMEKVYEKLNQILITGITVDGNPIDLEGHTVKHYEGKVLVPVRPVAEALGFDVTWNKDAYTATLNNGSIKSDVQVGFDMYNYSSVKAIGMSAPFSAGVAPKLIDSVLYVPTEYFSMFADEQVVDGILELTAR